MKTIARTGFASTLLLGLLIVMTGIAAAQPPIPHTLDGRSDCLSCHGPQGIKPYPANHAGRTNDMCRACHQSAATAPAATAVAVAPTKSAASSTAPTLSTPIALAPGATEASCVTCHRRMGGRFASVVSSWESSTHKTAGVACNGCHGGDPNAPTREAAMSPKAGYIGIPARGNIPSVCGVCHSDSARMRQYNLPTDQVDQYRTSLHGKLLATGDKVVPTCFDCHGGHAIRGRTDPQSTVYPTNVPATCGSCHADATKMKPYGIPTSQLDQYKASIHGVTLLQKQDLRAPTCASCHGNHGALPPGSTEVANVCGQCHSATQALYQQGGHASGAAGSGAPRCVTCHGQHDVTLPGEDLLKGSDARHCGSCHSPSTPQGRTAGDIATALVTASDAYEAAQKDVAKVEESHLLAVSAEGDLGAANTALLEARAAQHTVNLATVKEHTDVSIQSSVKVQQASARALADNETRRRIMVGVLAFVLVVAGLLWAAKRQVDAGLS